MRAGATPWIVDLSMKSHTVFAADIAGREVAGQLALPGKGLMSARGRKPLP